MPLESDKKRYVVVMVNAELWGAYNANQLLKAVAKRGFKPILIVSHSTKAKDGSIAVGKIPSLKEPRIQKEQDVERYFELIDGFLKLPVEKQKHRLPPEYLTFNQLAKRYCADGIVHHVSRGGPLGGEEAIPIFKMLEEKGMTPEIILSGDTMAILPSKILTKYPAFGTHPGPMPEVKGMHGTARSVIHKQLYDLNGKPMYDVYGTFIGDLRASPGAPMVKGTVFFLDPELDCGPPVEFVQSPAIAGSCLLQVRIDLYHELVSVMMQHLDRMLDPEKRNALVQSINQQVIKASDANPRVVPELTEEALSDWKEGQTPTGPVHDPYVAALCDMFGFPTHVKNQIIDPNYLRNRAWDFWPRLKPQTTISLASTESGRPSSVQDEYPDDPGFKKAFQDAFGKTKQTGRKSI